MVETIFEKKTKMIRSDNGDELVFLCIILQKESSIKEVVYILHTEMVEWKGDINIS